MPFEIRKCKFENSVYTINRDYELKSSANSKTM